MGSPKLSHIDEQGKASMVDVSQKSDTHRVAIARGEVHLAPETIDIIQNGLVKKGDVLSVAQIAGILGAKKTSDLIPLCHPLPLHHIEVNLELDRTASAVVITSSASTTGKTGVEMEALTAVSIAALTIYDMVKAVEKTGVITNIHLVEKHGGKSGDFYFEKK